MDDRPSRYNIEALLAKGSQPLPDLEDEELEALGKALGNRQLAVPICVSSDGILLDGHQRLKALASTGRKFIDANDVRVVADANEGNALEYAVRLNVQRRHITTEGKAVLARRLRFERRWSQRRIAKAFGVSQAAVSQWLARPDPDGYTPPEAIVGDDGREYATRRQDAARAKEPRSPWLVTEPGYKALTRARRMLQTEPVGKLGALQLAKLGQEVGDLIEAAEAMQNEIAELS